MRNRERGSLCMYVYVFVYTRVYPNPISQSDMFFLMGTVALYRVCSTGLR